MVQSQGQSRGAKFKVEKGGGSKDGKSTCANCGKKHYGECVIGIGSCIAFGKYWSKVRDYLMIDSRGRKGKKVAPSVQKNDDDSSNRRFYALCSGVEKIDEKESDDDVGNFSFFY